MNKRKLQNIIREEVKRVLDEDAKYMKPDFFKDPSFIREVVNKLDFYDEIERVEQDADIITMDTNMGYFEVKLNMGRYGDVSVEGITGERGRPLNLSNEERSMLNTARPDIFISVLLDTLGIRRLR